MDTPDKSDAEIGRSSESLSIEQRMVTALKGAGLQLDPELGGVLVQFGIVLMRCDPEFEYEDVYDKLWFDCDVYTDSDGNDLDLGLPPSAWLSKG